MSKEVILVSILNETYSLLSDESTEHLTQAADLVDGRMKQLVDAGMRDKEKLAVLVSLQLASQLLKNDVDLQKNKEAYQVLVAWLEGQNRQLSTL